MKRYLLLVVVVSCTGTTAARAGGVIPWPVAEQLPKGAALLADNQMQVVGPTAQPPVRILEVAKPKLTSPIYALRGKVKYEGVEKQGDPGTESYGYVEMWSHFPDGRQYFSRTLEATGPMARLEGASDWREIVLVFDASKAAPHLPEKLVVNVVLPGKGTVHLTPFTLVSGPTLATSAHEWWSERNAGLIGGLGGGVIGLAGALIGLLAGLGKSRSFVIGLCGTVIVIGSAGILVGLTALCLGQPRWVFFPPMLGGLIGVTVCGANLPGIRRRYDALELRKISALDATTGQVAPPQR